MTQELLILMLRAMEKHIYFTAIPAGGIEAIGVPAALVPLNLGTLDQRNRRVPQNGEINIYFPVDGEQPTTEEAVQYSYAKIDNIENSPITEWYMKMFSVLDNAEMFLEVGLDKTNASKKILNIDGLLNNDSHNDLPKKYSSQKDAFIKNFRKIASTAVGRTLLYRILIEIRRHDGMVDKKGCFDNGITIPTVAALTNRRNDCRHLTINWKPSGNSFSYPNKIINFGVQFPERKPTTVGQDVNSNYHEIILYSRSDDVGLLHEMIHWYHFLRHAERYTMERNADNGNIKINGKKESDTHTIHVHIGNYYWNTAEIDKWKLSTMPWFVVNGEELAVGFEEIRTILGAYSGIGYINGDDISENLYRSCNNYPMRFGHSGTAFYEDKSVIDKVKLACEEKRSIYCTGLYNNSMANSDNKEDKPKFGYASRILKEGIGYFKIPKIDVELIKP